MGLCIYCHILRPKMFIMRIWCKTWILENHLPRVKREVRKSTIQMNNKLSLRSFKGGNPGYDRKAHPPATRRMG